ncbi:MULTISPECIES: LysR family transcriptional regulator [unclassified Pseudomonas]|jgi:DNA-binding transcriptional LysR family regulator|uniref:LysR family transcriptional regulator n=1 Tax=unclassified Pseudomonas TaxID=196821 RepID=UPI000C2FB881|nr:MULTISPECIES: LysR family transcriptional regulator [unclassified Pseudomonas]MCU1740638.1 LysR family transcriptional regulator [Pseudomonas sp. 20S_6.2_Bac1]
MSVNEVPFSGLDLNLMLVFTLVFRERSVSRAAHCLRVTQPAVSGSLVRLRRYFGDPLFVRGGQSMRPTAKAREIAGLLLPAMAQIELLLTHHKCAKN